MATLEVAAAGFQAESAIPLGAVSAIPSVEALLVEVSASDLDELRTDPNVALVAEGPAVRTHDVEGHALIRAGYAHDLAQFGAGITIAVLDTGVDASHPALAEAVVGEACFTSDSCTDGAQVGAGAARDLHGHGTAVAGIIAGRATETLGAGVAPGASIFGYRVLSDSGSGSFTDVLAALNDILENRPEVDVVNMSLGTSNGFAPNCDNIDVVHEAMASVVQQLRARGTLVVAASGNSGLTGALSSPSCLTSVISVGAVYDADIDGGASYGAPSSCSDSARAADRLACYSNSSSSLDVLAPSHCAVTATLLHGATSCFGGTSAAAPYVAGGLALFLARGANTDLAASMLAYGPQVADHRTGADGRLTPRLDLQAPLAALSVDSGTSSVSTPDDSITANGSSAATVTIALVDGAGDAVGGLPSVAFSTQLAGSAAAGPVTETATPGTYNVSVTNTEADGSTFSVSVAGSALVQTTSIAFHAAVVDGAQSTSSLSPITPVSADGTSAATATFVIRDQTGTPMAGIPSSSFEVTLSGAAVASSVLPVEGAAGNYRFAVTNTVAETVTVGITAVGVAVASVLSVEFVAPPPPPPPPSGGGGG
ncbi:MAG: S8 family serine peptidase, partial [Dehalococcoidia bacterium]